MRKSLPLLIPAILIIGWWGFAFYPHFFPSHPRAVRTIAAPPSIPCKCGYHLELSPLDRERIHRALNGDYRLMAALIAEWDLDAELLSHAGVEAVQRLSREDYLRSQTILQGQVVIQGVEQDDQGYRFSLENTYTPLLPQTYASASILLALSPSDNIGAIPSGIRSQTTLHPTARTKKVRCTVEECGSESLFAIQPGIAFVSPYSDPKKVESFREKEIPLFTLKSSNGFEEILSTIRKVGNTAGRSREGELLCHFVRAGMMAIDNRMTALIQSRPRQPTFAFLTHYSRFSVPGKKSLSGNLLRTFSLKPELFSQANEWKTPLDRELLLTADPDCLIISVAGGKGEELCVGEDPAFHQLKAVKNGALFTVSETVQQSPTQYALLAYFDIASAYCQACQQQ